MRRVLYLVALLVLGFQFVPSAKETPYTFYVQFIRATNDEQPGNPEWKQLGPKLSGSLSPVFRWEHYWEVSRSGVAVSKGQSRRVQLGSDRELRIRVTPDARVELQHYWKGELRRKFVRELDDKMCIFGGDRGDNDAWFIVVRRDKPSLD
ncbi:MAG TPA: hypothetical protein VI454_07920 [Verrucomicrobiae bacterium]|jgi:hypothetical protein